MVNYERIRKSELFWGTLVSVPLILSAVAFLLTPMRESEEIREMKSYDFLSVILSFSIFVLVPPLAVTLGAYIHTIGRTIVGYWLILLVGIPMMLAHLYVAFVGLYGLNSWIKFAQWFLLILPTVFTVLTIFYGGVYGNPAKHLPAFLEPVRR